MVFSLDKESIYNLFGADDFFSLESIIDNIAPSLLDYHFSNFCNNAQEVEFFNKREVENSFYSGIYSLFLDYNQNLFLEVDDVKEDDSTSSFW
ncbi:hypothetical protein AFAEC_1140 [Aliarcobacter faecis]|uniref:hypothetical protein n=1 Tax=Aliarcobacter faecis TaxID=1564138 RepID=UPI000479D8BB|nr:hypothetical protein [Aliarcobacter faecis]QKF73305.1 hypothetical protein AFAEC_1140 [Aliarcobacter faecis]